MSFMEWWGEEVEPGKVGGVDLSGEHEACRCRPLVLVRFVAVVVGLPVFWYLVTPHVPLPAWQAVVLVVGGTLIYVAFSYLINPEPDLENLGVAGGLIDHPWRFSDDLNRLLLYAQCFLGPGRFVAESVLDVRELFRNDEDRSQQQDERLGW